MATIRSNPLLTQTFHGYPLGINQTVPPQEIPDTMVRWIQDMFLDKAGEARQRGPVKPASGVSATIAAKPQGLFSVIAPDLTVRIAAFTGTATPQIQLFNSAFSSATAINWGSDTWTNPPVYQANPALKGGALLGTAQSHTASSGNLGIWKGSTKADYTTGTLTSTRGSTAITGSGTSWSANVEAGAFVFKTASAGGAGQKTLIGTVASVNSNTSITLSNPALTTVAGANYLITSVRGASVRLGTGRLTAASTDTNVYGAATKFNMMSVLGGTWDIYRASDMTWVGTVSSITNDTQLVLAANAAISLSNDAYLAIRLAPTENFAYAQTTALSALGSFNTVYQGRQFYAFGTKVAWSELHDPEAVDLSPADGNFFNVTSQSGGNHPIMGIVGLQNAMAILKEEELFGLYGSDPNSFQLRKIADVGAISPMSIVTYKSGVIFAGRNGIYHFDGTAVQELSAAIGPAYRDAMVNFSTTTDRAYAAIYRNHYMLSLTAFTPTYEPTRGSVSTAITAGTLVMNLDTGAIGWFTNFQFKGWVSLPAASGFDALYVVEKNSDSSTVIGDAVDLWTGTGVDTTQTKGQSVGPQLYIETKRYDARDAERLKSFKQLAMHYTLEGDSLNMDTVPGLGETGTTENQPWLPQTVFKNQRIKFTVRDTHVGFRIYPTLGNVTSAVIGPYSVGFKLQRVGRI